MTYFEPVRVDPRFDSRWDSATYYGFWGILKEMGFRKIAPVPIYEKLASDIENSLQKSLRFDPKLRDEIAEETAHKITQSMCNFRNIYTRDSFAIFSLNRGTEQCYMFVSESKQRVESLISKINQILNELRESEQKRTNVGPTEENERKRYDFRLVRGRELAKQWTKEFSPEINSVGCSENKLEQEVKSDIESNITTCVSSGVDLSIDIEHNENKEFDLLLYLTPTSRVYIEVKDALKSQGIKNEIDWKKKLIQIPWEYTTLLQEYTKINNSDSYISNIQTTACFVIVRGFDGDITEYKNIANNRRIEILEYDENEEYLEAIRRKVREIVIEQTGLRFTEGSFEELDLSVYGKHKL